MMTCEGHLTTRWWRVMYYTRPVPAQGLFFLPRHPSSVLDHHYKCCTVLLDTLVLPSSRTRTVGRLGRYRVL